LQHLSDQLFACEPRRHPVQGRAAYLADHPRRSGRWKDRSGRKLRRPSGLRRDRAL